MSAALLLLPLLLGTGPPSDAPTQPRGALAPAAQVHAASGTHCQSCHSVKGWQVVSFPHEKTGFPLKGGHAQVTCKACHPVDFVQQVPQVCSGCHRDAHEGTLGQRCEGCHTETSWRTTFTADAHRMTNFPLTGRHAMLPCESCHPDARERVFSRQTVDCVGCHLNDDLGAASKGIDHAALGFEQQCRHCHDVVRFSPARYLDHERCFQLIGGAHAGLACLSCHTQVIPNTTCTTHTAACTQCHDHEKTRTDAQHRSVPNYQYQSGMCYGCHQFSG